jgi:hypothetical protein
VAPPRGFILASAETPVMVRTEGGLIPAAQAERILHIGDSMAPFVANYLKGFVKASGRKYWVDSEHSTTTLSWAQERRLQAAMYRYDPQVILISLGSNEVHDRTPERRAPAIRQIIKDTRGRACLWISPPVKKPDYPFLQVLRSNLGHCHYLDSSRVKMTRMEDGYHPTWTGGYRWASEVWRVLGGTEKVPTGSENLAGRKQAAPRASAQP